MQFVLSSLLLATAPPDSGPELQVPDEEVPLIVEWSAPEGCPDRPALLDDVRELLPDFGDPPAAGGRARLRIRARVEAHTGDGYDAIVELLGVGTQMNREFGAPDCADLTHAVALIVAVALDPITTVDTLGLTDAPEPEPEPEPAPEPAPEPEPEPEPAPELEPLTLVVEDPVSAPPRVRPRLGLRAFGGGGYGPTQTGYGSLGAGVSTFASRWRVQLDGGWFLPRVRRLDDGRGARLQGWWVGGQGCFVPARGSVEFPLCAGLEAGQVLGAGIAPTQNPDSARFPWIAARLSPSVAWAPLRRLALGVEVSLLVPFVRGAFEIDAVELDALATVGMRGSIFVELRLF